MGFVWSKFGSLTGTFEDDRYLYITNATGEQRQISISKYSPAIPNLRKKIELLIGKNCIIRTSQNTGNWSEEKWFSEISLDGSSQGISSPAHNLESDYESYEELQEKLTEAENTISKKDEIIKAKDNRIQDELEISNALKDELAEKDLEISKLRASLKDEFNQLPAHQRKQIDYESEQLKKLIEIGDMHDFEVHRNSHPRRELALRLGIALHDNQTRVPMKVLQHVDKNNYSCELLDNNVMTVASIGHGKGFYVKSFRNPNDRWWECIEIETGKPDSYYKDNIGMSLEELVEVFRKVEKRLV